MQYNKVFLIGNLTLDPEMRYTTAGIAVTHFTVAVNRFGRDGDKAEADFINVVAWRRLAEICGEYLKKGSPVAVEGRLQIRSYDGKDGQKRTMTEVIADNLQMLGRKTAAGSAPQAEAPHAEMPAQPPAEDEIPF